MVLTFPDTDFALSLEEQEDEATTQSPFQVMAESDETSITTFWEPAGAVGTDVSDVPVKVVV